RVVAWALDHIEGKAPGVSNALGVVPADGELNLDGLDMAEGAMDELFRVDPDAWLAEADLTEEYFAQFGDKIRPELRDQLATLRANLQAAKG
ncbi:MAG: phosphoenolpyruvate carboxykinase domain-containing protein, partial [Micrococcales bacterium]|nr:phosphoenolpyruvate carboxykinase domain-containing protein [Micrococcales bacterium]